MEMEIDIDIDISRSIQDIKNMLTVFLSVRIANVLKINKFLDILIQGPSISYIQLYSVYDILDKFNLANDILEFGLLCIPDDQNLLLMLGYHNTEMSFQINAEKYVFLALKKYKNWIPLLYILINIQLKFNDYYTSDDIIIICKQILNLDPLDAYALYCMSYVCPDPLIQIYYLRLLYHLNPEKYIIISCFMDEVNIHQYIRTKLYKLDSKEYYNLLYQGKDYYDNTCKICMRRYNGLDIHKLFCGHYFHGRCLGAYKNDYCPLCRETIKYIFDDSELYDDYTQSRQLLRSCIDYNNNSNVYNDDDDIL